MSAPAGTYKSGVNAGKSYWIDDTGSITLTDPSPETGNEESGGPTNVTPPKRTLDQGLLEDQANLAAQMSGSGGDGELDTPDKILDSILKSVMENQFPTRMQGLLGSIIPAQAQANGSPMAMSNMFAPQLSGMQQQIGNVLKQNSMRFGPSGGGMLDLGKEAGLLPIQRGVAALPGQTRQQGQKTLMDIATSTSILHPSPTTNSSSNSTSTSNGPDDYTGLVGSIGGMGKAFGNLLGQSYGDSSLGSSMWNWMYQPTTPSFASAGTMPNMSSAAPLSSGGGYYP